MLLKCLIIIIGYEKNTIKLLLLKNDLNWENVYIITIR